MKKQDNTLLLMGLNKAVLGIVKTGQSVYCYNSLVQEIMEQRSLSRIDAIEFVDFNIVNAYLGEFTPVIVYPIDEDDA